MLGKSTLYKHVSSFCSLLVLMIGEVRLNCSHLDSLQMQAMVALPMRSVHLCFNPTQETVFEGDFQSASFNGYIRTV